MSAARAAALLEVSKQPTDEFLCGGEDLGGVVDPSGGVDGRGVSALVREGGSGNPSGEAIGENSKGMSRQSGSPWRPALVRVSLGAAAGEESRAVK